MQNVLIIDRSCMKICTKVSKSKRKDIQFERFVREGTPQQRNLAHSGPSPPPLAKQIRRIVVPCCATTLTLQ